MRKLAVGIVFAALAVTFAPSASAVDPNSPEGALQGILEGFGGAFGSSKPRAPRAQSYIYPDFQSCNREANRLRRPGVIAECQPLGGYSGQYQLIYMP
ncbi:hypothetical protein [Nocardia sp. NPDC051463]|uniref:hypothetical protein n=1 Tax=Nocardia sp. NPDC051463 TaxID=3154845 RepID=UPI00344DDB7D